MQEQASYSQILSFFIKAIFDIEIILINNFE